MTTGWAASSAIDGPAGFADALAEAVEPVQRALVAAYGIEVGVEAAADARAWAWEHRENWISMDNRAGYLFRVGQSAARKYRRSPIVLPAVEPAGDGFPIAPELPAALAALSTRQRAAVVMVHAHGYGLTEAADVLGLSVSTLRNHLDRGLRRLRKNLKVADDD